MAYFGIGGEPVLHKDGYARFTNTYDAHGHCIKEAYFGFDGERAPHKDGFRRIAYVYDTRGNLVEQTCFGIDFTRVAMAYDAHGNRIEEAYFGVDDKPVLNNMAVCASPTSMTPAQLHRTDPLRHQRQPGDVL